MGARRLTVATGLFAVGLGLLWLSVRFDRRYTLDITFLLLGAAVLVGALAVAGDRSRRLPGIAVVLVAVALVLPAFGLVREGRWVVGTLLILGVALLSLGILLVRAACRLAEQLAAIRQPLGERENISYRPTETLSVPDRAAHRTGAGASTGRRG